MNFGLNQLSLSGSGTNAKQSVRQVPRIPLGSGCQEINNDSIMSVEIGLSKGTTDEVPRFNTASVSLLYPASPEVLSR